MKRTPQGMSQDEKIAQGSHITRPPRLEGKVKNAKMYSSKKQKKS